MSKDVQLFWYILIHRSLKSIDKWQRYGHFIACGSGFKNDTLDLSLLTEFYTHYNKLILYVCLYDRQFQISNLQLGHVTNHSDLFFFFINFQMCNSCCGFKDEQPGCDSLDCPVRYKLNRTVAQLQQVPFYQSLLDSLVHGYVYGGTGMEGSSHPSV